MSKPGDSNGTHWAQLVNLGNRSRLEPQSLDVKHNKSLRRYQRYSRLGRMLGLLLVLEWPHATPLTTACWLLERPGVLLACLEENNYERTVYARQIWTHL